ncbi:hypothetical protein B5D80_19655 [Micromonospora wenchangensis]|uniref:Restriction endonuclease type IV Mrr domain-containing protein n=1 Tax=Micromonospora wenchangensis TaxID=1185415 RepID=A0A246RJ33_9ACTN|nr:hypothetical protein [Micromonospora wenchangensis]OWV04710.1 hypothetical protein B5D80_19655 [Micromonospora wenchangensis]
MINWTSAARDPARFERAMKMLIKKTDPRAQGVDGAGGDGGRDSYVPTRFVSGDGMRVYEVKSFTGRLTGSRRSQVKKSLAMAVKEHSPSEWVLIIPLEFSPAEIVWWESLEAQYPDVTLDRRCTDWLDEQFRQDEGLRRFLEGDEYYVSQRLAELNLEQAGMVGGVPDLFHRQRTLHARATEMAPRRWDWTISAGENYQKVEIRPRPGTDATVSVRGRFAFPADDAEAATVVQRWRDALAFGGAATVEQRFVEDVTMVLPEDLREVFPPSSGPGTVQFSSPQAELTTPVLLHLVAEDCDGNQVSRLPISFTTRLAGSMGATIVGTDVSRTVTAQLQMTYEMPPAEEAEDGWQALVGQLKLSWASPIGHLPSTLRPMAELIKACVGDGASLYVWLGRQRVARLPTAMTADLAEDADLVLLLDDLQEHLGLSEPVPDDLTESDVSALTMAWAVLSTGQGSWPDAVIDFHVAADGVNAFMTHRLWSSEPGELVLTHPRLVISSAGLQLDLGPVEIRLPRVAVQNRADIEDAARAGTSVIARFAACDGATPLVTSLPAQPG